ncbi:MAG: diaminopimelate decarboxylase [Patescibacteria group bacterium]|nr:diaminopimelate decarboxylase [Patescibacteria group bacterium]
MRPVAMIKPFMDCLMSRGIATEWGTPTFVYCEDLLREAAGKACDTLPTEGLTVRYAMKANPVKAVLRLFDAMGLHIDASSGFEASRAMKAGVEPGRILLTTQELPNNLGELIGKGVAFDACSLRQLEVYGMTFRGSDVGLRINPGFGNGHSRGTTVGGPYAPFGIWHEELGEARRIAESHGLTVKRIHLHIGSGSDAVTAYRASRFGVEMLSLFSEVAVLNLGGGFPVDRMTGEQDSGIREAVRRYAIDLSVFRRDTGRHIRLEIEPGAYLVANAGILLATVKDVKRAGSRKFIIIDSGMTEIMRPAFYGALHPIWICPPQMIGHGRARYTVVGHCCESSDLITTRKRAGSVPVTRELPLASVGDLMLIGGVGAYCDSMSAKNYNSFPEAAEVMVDLDGKPRLIRRRQTLEQMTQNELP